MSRIADYVVITDSSHEMHKRGVRPVREEFEFNLQSGAHISSRAVLAFVLKVESDADDLHLKVTINESYEIGYTFSGFRSSSTLHEVISKDVLKADGENEIKFRLDEGEGGLKFGDVVLFYQKDI